MTDLQTNPGEAVILFDGVCVLCSWSYRFVRARDPDRHFRFVAIQEAEGQALARRFAIDPDNPSTFVLIEGDIARVRSDAVLRIVARLPGWRWMTLLRVVPRGLRDRLYDLVARNRYRWFGRLDACGISHASMIPPDP
jgi:predicted DCC family thiol-disulfide oxidoreductase YuxK